MATGIIDSLEASSNGLKTGKVKTDETADLLMFTDQPIECGLGDTVQFDIVMEGNTESTADKLASLKEGVVQHKDHPIKTTIDEDIIIGPDETLTVRKGGIVTGKIIIQGGKLRVVEGGIVTGKITIQRSGTANIIGGGVKNDILAEEAELIKITDGGIVTGKITIQKGLKMVLDQATILGQVSAEDAFKIIIKSKSSIGS